VQDCTGHKISCSFPLKQEITTVNESADLEIRAGSNNPTWNQTEPPLSGIHGIQIFNDTDKTFLLWLSPDKFIHHYYNHLIEATIIGDYRPLTSFDILYVGKATDQDVWDRLGTHKTLQEILSVLRPVGNTIPTHEICLLLFEVTSKWEFNIYDSQSDPYVIGEHLANPMLPTHNTVSMDAEKALVTLLNPSFNTVKFKKYPFSTDGLHKFDYNGFAFQFLEDISLQSEKGSIFCSSNENECDLISIVDNKEVEIISLKNSS